MRPGVKVALMVVGLFLLMASAWTALFMAASRARVETVPLAPAGEPVADQLNELHRSATGATSNDATSNGVSSNGATSNDDRLGEER